MINNTNNFKGLGISMVIILVLMVVIPAIMSLTL
jgi:tetrahydromethanopterin S-methyltransferase subunit F